MKPYEEQESWQEGNQTTVWITNFHLVYEVLKHHTHKKCNRKRPHNKRRKVKQEYTEVPKKPSKL